MSLMTYNGVTLPYSQTTDFKQEVLYYQDVDWYLTKYYISVQCLINASYISEISSKIAAGTTDPATIMLTIRNKLMQPRKTLSFQVGGVEMIPRRLSKTDGPEIPGTVDAQNGPQPHTCSYISLTNSSFLLLFGITAHYWENNLNSRTGLLRDGNQNLQSNSVIYNRWTESVEYDTALYCTRVREGKYCIRSDNLLGRTADHFREDMASLALTPGCMRVRSRYKISPDGLGIEYLIADQEVFRRPPPPAYEASGEYMESTSEAAGIMRSASCMVRLRGSRTGQRFNQPIPFAPLPQFQLNPQDAGDVQMQLFAAAVGIVTSKLQVNGAVFLSNVAPGSRGANSILESGYFKIDLYKNEVECMLKVKLFPRSLGTPNRIRTDGIPALALTQGGAAMGAGITLTPYSDGINYNPSLPIRGTLAAIPGIQGPSAGLLLQTAMYYDPNLVSNIMNQFTGQLSAARPGNIIGTAGLARESI